MAKYSLEVFASMMGKDDTLNVYRMSDFADGTTSKPAVSVKGDVSASQRVARIHDMDLKGGDTPYSPVETAMADLAKSSEAERWLVILSDGEFDDRSSNDVDNALSSFVSENSSETKTVRVAFLGLGKDAPKLKNAPKEGIFYERARKTDDLLDTMTGFSNRIFAKSKLKATSSGKFDPDVDLDEVLVFAQGADVRIGNLTAGTETFEPGAEVDVSWVDNPDAIFEGTEKTEAVPDKNLRGKLATYSDVPAGASAVDVKGAKHIDAFYTPHAAFGFSLLDADGKKVDADKIVGGDYTVNYGFMDQKCNIVGKGEESDLLGEIKYTGTLSQDGKEDGKKIGPGDKLHLEQGQAQFSVEATYLGGNTSTATVDLKVLRPAKPGAFTTEMKTFAASELADYRIDKDAQKLHYALDENGSAAEFTEAEWASFFDEESGTEPFTATSSEKDIEFDIKPGKGIGDVLLLPKAPDGDPYKAATGKIPVTITASHVYDEQLNEATYKTNVVIDNDISWFDRAMNWFLTIGWKWLLIALVLIIIAGYILRPRFPRDMKDSPKIKFLPGDGSDEEPKTFKGKFHSRRSLLPYKAPTGTLSYVRRSEPGFVPLRLKARRNRMMTVQNWGDLVKRENVKLDGKLLDQKNSEPRPIGASTRIEALGTQGKYTSRPNT
ncbi:MAG: hypothetical protein ACTH9H_12190 [Galactobacter sp.]